LNTETGSPARPTRIVEKLTVKLDAQQLTRSKLERIAVIEERLGKFPPPSDGNDESPAAGIESGQQAIGRMGRRTASVTRSQRRFGSEGLDVGART